MSDRATAADMASDNALLEAVQRRDQAALAALYDRYGGLALGLANRILGDRGVAEEVVQEAFVNIWRRAGSFQAGRGSVRTWLLSVVHHRAIDRLRGASGRALRDTSLDEVDQLLIADDPWREVSMNVQRDELRRSLGTLPEAQRRTIELVYFSGYTQQEAATIMAVPLGTVKGRLRMALLKLRDLLIGTELEEA